MDTLTVRGEPSSESAMASATPASRSAFVPFVSFPFRLFRFVHSGSAVQFHQLVANGDECGFRTGSGWDLWIFRCHFSVHRKLGGNARIEELSGGWRTKSDEGARHDHDICWSNRGGNKWREKARRPQHQEQEYVSRTLISRPPFVGPLAAVVCFAQLPSFEPFERVIGGTTSFPRIESSKHICKNAGPGTVLSN